jgi:hypothetical protein
MRRSGTARAARFDCTERLVRIADYVVVRATSAYGDESQQVVTRDLWPFLQEKVQSGVDRLAALVFLGWALLIASSASVVDLAMGREIPHPDLKQVAPSPEPIRQNKAA